YLIKDKEDAWRIASNIVNISTIFLVGIAILGTIFSYYIIRAQTFLTPASADKVGLASFFFKYFVWEIVFYGFCAVLNGILQSFRRFTWPAAAPIFNNLVTIFTVLFVYLPLHRTHPQAALVGLALGTTLGVLAMALVQFPALFKAGYKHYWILDFHDAAFLKMASLSLPILGYVTSNQLGQIVVNLLAYKYEGGFTAWTYAWRFYQLPYGILAVSIATALFPRISEQASKKEISSFKESLSLGIRATGFVILPATVAIFLLSRPLILATLHHYNFSYAGSIQTAKVLSYFVLGLFPFAVHIFLTRMFYARKDTITPMKINALGVPLMVTLDIILVRYFEVAGLSLGNSLTYIFTMSLLLIAIRRRIGPLGARKIVVRTVRFALASILMGAAIVLVLQIPALRGDSFGASVAQLVVGSTVGIFVYLVINIIIKTEELDFIRSIFAGVLRKIKS
ncbi:MAG TPA: murein biosynthesis integral membrane protein MurJ, partial [Actinobacteria bacterium]|nr:murein biosynthesis integral membrane protein MurJ [Actinomycetes bacterium]HEX21359.1 murein biosynthesis integral membrane protein MurJ [Actinomycetota bacterium]